MKAKWVSNDSATSLLSTFIPRWQNYNKAVVDKRDGLKFTRLIALINKIRLDTVQITATVSALAGCDIAVW